MSGGYTNGSFLMKIECCDFMRVMVGGLSPLMVIRIVLYPPPCKVAFISLSLRRFD